MKIVLSIIVFLVFITIHELGHFLAAKISGIRVDEFAVGMGPKILSKQKGETLYSLRLIPIGGFCALAGEEEESQDPRAFNNAGFWPKIFTMAAGAMNNFIFGLIVCILVCATITSSTTIHEIVPDSPAMKAGLKEGDRILKFDGQEISTIEQMQVAAQNSKGQEKSIEIKNTEGKESILKIKPEKSENSNLYTIGVQFKTDYNIKNFNILRGFKLGFKMFTGMLTSLFQVLGLLFTGKVGVKNLSGPVGVISQIGKAAELGIPSLLFFLAYINVNLGVVNLLPIPALDGGRILIMTVEKIIGKEIPKDKENIIHLIGFALLMLLILYVTFQDVIRLF